MNFASPFWQGILFLVAILFLLWEIRGGWRRGILRSALHFSTFILSGVFGFFAGQATAFVIERSLPGYGLLFGILTGVGAALLIFILALVLGAILFKRTEQQPAGLIRFFYGCGGAFFGLLTGLLLLWGGISLIRTLGVATKIFVETHPSKSLPPAAKAIFTLEESLVFGPAGKIVEAVDPVPPEIYSFLRQITQLTRQQDAMMRFLDDPAIQKIIQHPQMIALLEDASVTQALEQRDFFSLLRNQEILATLQDANFRKLFLEVNLEKALNRALPKQATLPSPEKIPDQ